MATVISKKGREGGGNNVLLSLACVVVIVAGLKLASQICIPIAMGVFLGVLSLPILSFFNHTFKMPRRLAVLSTVLIDLLLIGTMIYVVSGIVPQIQRNAPKYAERLKGRASEYSIAIDQRLEKIERWTNLGNQDEAAPRSIPTFKELLNRYWDTQRIVDLIGGADIVGRFTSLASKSIFVIILMSFFIAESQRFALNIEEVARQRGPDLRWLQNSSKDIQNYLLLKSAVSLVTGLLAWGGCALMNVEFALLWGLLAFVLNFIPVIGSIVAGVPPVLLALIMQGFWPAVIVFSIFMAINMTLGHVLEPKILGDSFGISTIVVILSVLTWGFIWGGAGMFLAVPLTMMVKVILDNTPELRWISTLISNGRENDHTESNPKHLKPLPVNESNGSTIV